MKIKFNATMRRYNIEGGIWLAETTDGRKFQLSSEVPELMRDGVKFSAVGELDNQTIGIGMVAPYLKIEQYKVQK